MLKVLTIYYAYAIIRKNNIGYTGSNPRNKTVADLAKPVTDRRGRAKIARDGGYSAKVIEGMLNKRRKENEEE